MDVGADASLGGVEELADCPILGYGNETLSPGAYDDASVGDLREAETVGAQTIGERDALKIVAGAVVVVDILAALARNGPYLVGSVDEDGGEITPNVVEIEVLSGGGMREVAVETIGDGGNPNIVIGIDAERRHETIYLLVEHGELLGMTVEDESSM